MSCIGRILSHQNEIISRNLQSRFALASSQTSVDHNTLRYNGNTQSQRLRSWHLFGSLSAANHNTYSTMVATEEWKSAKPFSAIPGPLLLPYIGSLYQIPIALLPFTLANKNNNENLQRKFKKYGSIMKEQFGSKETDSLVTLFDAEAVEKLHQYDGKTPKRLITESWESWREEYGHGTGLLTQNGPEWQRMRSLLNKQMLRPTDVVTYSESLEEVTEDFISRIKSIREPDTRILNNLAMELFHWSLESVGTVLYETRFGGLSDDRTPDMAEFVQAVEDMLYATNRLFMLPRRISKRVMPRMTQLHDRSWEIIFKTAIRRVDEKMAELQKLVEEDKEVSGFLSVLLASGKMSPENIYGNLSELMLAGVDTTSNTMQWVIYELSRHPEIQATIRDEVLSIAPRGSVPTYTQVHRMSYLKGYIKEILRLYPIVGFETRLSSEDMVIAGYHIPPNIRIVSSSYVLGHDPNNYPDPETIRPERWIRSNKNKTTHSYAWIPFSIGPRMCIGRRVAELELMILTATLVQEFELVFAEDKPNLPTAKPFVVPRRPVKVQFLDRI